MEALRQCEIRLKTSNSEEKRSRKTAEKGSNGTVIWKEEDEPTELVVRQRYGSAVTLAFKDPTGLKKSGKKALAVLWLRDLIDNEDRKLEIPLWKSEDYSRLKQNYLPPDGNLDAWDEDREKITRIGTLQLDLTFQPGVSSAHKKALKTSDPAKRRVWDEVDRRDAAGLTEKVGQREGGTDELANGENTLVDEHDVQVDEEDPDASNGNENGEGGSDDDNDSGGKGLITKLKEWKNHEHELHKQHRGIMQKKPARTAAWVKGNVKEVGHKVKDRFSMTAREPDVETEV